MIIDSLDHVGMYTKEFPILETVCQILESTDFLALEAGKYTTQYKEISYSIVDYELTKEKDTRYEAHKIETDLQIVLKGKERFDIAWSQPVEVVTSYVPDIYFIQGDKALSVTLKENTFILLFPEEPHIPCLVADKEDRFVRKVIFKLTIPQ